MRRSPDPFADPTLRRNLLANPYLLLMKEAAQQEALPILYGSALQGLAGGWRNYFYEKRGFLPRRLVVEVGSHYGTTLTAMAQDFPEDGFIGLDLTYKRVVKAARRAQRFGLNNVICLLFDASFLQHIFAANELSGIIVFFPDPWNKHRQRKHRLLNRDSLHQYRNLLQETGFFWFKTDQENYYSDVLVEAENQTFLRTDLKIGNFTQSYTSSFEQLFLRQGIPAFEAIFAKAAPASESPWKVASV